MVKHATHPNQETTLVRLVIDDLSSKKGFMLRSERALRDPL
jgi:hypothetical protein